MKFAGLKVLAFEAIHGGVAILMPGHSGIRYLRAIDPYDLDDFAVALTAVLQCSTCYQQRYFAAVGQTITLPYVDGDWIIAGGILVQDQRHEACDVWHLSGVRVLCPRCRASRTQACADLFREAGQRASLG